MATRDYDQEDWIDRIEGMWPSNAAEEDVTPVLRELQQALGAYPKSAELTCMKGDLVQLTGDARSAMELYQKAIALDPLSQRALRSLGQYHDAISGDLNQAREYFKRALSLGPDRESVYGFARVLAQQGEDKEAIKFLRGSMFHDAEDIQKLVREIESGTWSP